MSDSKAGVFLCITVIFFLFSELFYSNKGPEVQSFSEQPVSQMRMNIPEVIAPTLDRRILVESGDYHVVVDNTEVDNTRILKLEYSGTEDSMGMSEIIKNLKMIISFHPNDVLRVKITDWDKERWEIPEIEPFPFFRDKTLLKGADSKYTVDVQEKPFSFKVTRNDNNEVIFDSTGRKFIFSYLYIELTAKVPSDNIFGYGERFSKFKLNKGTWTIWGRDEPKVLDSGRGGGNIYGHHPVGLIRDEKGKFFIVLMKNSNAMDVITENAENVETLSYKIVGGIIDLVFFAGDEYPDTALVKYHEFIGKFVMMPFWSMGYHQCRWGYKTQGKLEEIINNFDRFNIPIDTIWSDIDYMIDKEDFTINTGAFPPAKMHEMFNNKRVHYVPIIDAGIKVSGHGADVGKKKQVFVETNNGDYFVGSVWPGAVYFVDFFHPEAENFWIEMLDYTYQQIHYSGIWLDMNEIANFDHGFQNHQSPYDTIPYTPGIRILRTKTLSLESVHHGNILELNVHELHSILQNKATYNALKKRTKLPFILTRSSSFGTGQYSAHWTGDNGADWAYLQISIPGNFNFQIFGQPFVGADICGFMDTTNAELCARWIQLGALYPFSRNHNQDISKDQEPWVFEAFGDMGKNVLPTYQASVKFKYSILKWFYTQYIERNGAGSVWRPIFFEFPNEDVYNTPYIEREFMIGKGMLFIPATERGILEQVSYFPKARWFDFFTGKEMINEAAIKRDITVQMPFKAPAPTFIRGGYIVHSQNVDKVLRTDDLGSDFILNVAFGTEKEGVWQAEGTIMGIQKFTDDNVYDRCVTANCLYNIRAKVEEKIYGLTTIHVNFEAQDLKTTLEEIGIQGFNFFGLPFGFMPEDDAKVGYAIAELYDASRNSISKVNAVECSSVSEGAFSFKFEQPLSIKTGNFFKIQILI